MSAQGGLPFSAAIRPSRACGRLRGLVDTLARRARPKSAPVEGEHESLRLPDDGAQPGRRADPSKAMPVILTMPEEVHLWLAADAPKALGLQRPVARRRAEDVTSGEKEDGPLREK